MTPLVQIPSSHLEHARVRLVAFRGYWPILIDHSIQLQTGHCLTSLETYMRQRRNIYYRNICREEHSDHQWYIGIQYK